MSSQVATTSTGQVSEVTNWDAGKVSAMKKLGTYIGALQNTVSTANGTVPTHYVDPTVVAGTGLMVSVDEFINSPPENALIRIDWYDGFPVVEGSPVWERLEGELVPYYSLFKQYRDLKGIKGTRSLFDLSVQSGVPLAVINILKDVYHWKMRAVAFDRFKEEQNVQLRQNNIEQMESKHRKTARKLFDQVFDFMQSEEAIKEMDPKTALGWFEMAVKLERLSLGMAGDKPGVGGANTTNIQINNTPSAFPNDPTMNANQKAQPQDDTRTMEILKILQQAGAFNKAEVIEVETQPIVGSEKAAGSEPAVVACLMNGTKSNGHCEGGEGVDGETVVEFKLRGGTEE